MPPELRAAKPAFVYDPYRELEAYRRLLPGAHLGTAVCYGGVVQPVGAERERYWLFLERVTGQDLYLVGDLALWQQAAAWLAALHAQTQRRPGVVAQAAHLLRYDAGYYARWQERACSFLAQRTPPGLPAHEIDELCAVYGSAANLLLALPQVWIHGEFYASNVLIQSGEMGVRVCPVDWEMTGLGPGLMDVAALTAGNWPPAARAAMVESYYHALADQDMARPSPADFAVHLACCRLHSAMQWLGWSLTWSPPPEHAHDWLAEARSLAAELDPLL